MDKFEYKGYQGSVEYDDEDKYFYGKVLGMSQDLITYEGNSVEELEEDFKGALESYFEGCKKHKIAPRKPYDGLLNISIPSEIHKKIVQYADKNGISVNTFIMESINRNLIHI